jgi:hypothetical protein
MSLSETRRAELARSYVEQTVTTLRLAVKQGYRDAARLQRDPSFATVRSLPSFKELLTELEKRP